MNERSNDRGHPLQLIAAAVLLALGTVQAGAQQPGSEQETEQRQQQDEPLGAQQEEDPFAAEESESQQAQQEQEEEARVAAAEGQAGGAEALDRIAEEHQDLSTFVEAVKAAGMEDALTGATEYTVFAPTNDAFEQMSGMSTEELLRPENREQLISLLRAHIVADDVDETMARSLPQAQTIDGGTVDLSAEEEEIQVGDATVVESGIQSGNLRVYAIDDVLSPGTAVARADQTAEQPQEESETEQPFETEREETDPFETEREDDPFGQEPGAGQTDQEAETEDRIGLPQDN